MTQNRSGLHYGELLLGLAVLLILLAAAAFTYLRFGPVPVAVSDQAFPFEKRIVRIAVRARIGREAQSPPFAANEQVLEDGASVYQEQCSMCHGLPGHDAAFSHQMFPPPPQLWKRHGAEVGLSGEEPGFSYWVVSNGLRLTGMPSFSHTLSDKERWEVSLLLKNANKQLPPEVDRILNASGAH